MKARILTILAALALATMVIVSLRATSASAMGLRKTPTPTQGKSPTTINLSNWNDTSLWEHEDGYGNGGVFNVGWRADHATTSGSNLTFTLDNKSCPSSCSGYPYASEEFDTQALYKYGTYTVQMQAAKGSGVVSAFFTYINMSSNDSEEKNDEIDVEIPGARTTTLETTYYKLGKPTEHTIQLPFDASTAMHTYAIQWLPNSISWIVDGQTLYTATGSPSTMPTNASNLDLNFWTGTSELNDWLGPFNYTGPLHVVYGSASFTPAP
jgi:endo-1,3-1,4-beta-glycanase ExoK